MAVGIGAVAAAVGVYKDATKDVFFDQEAETIANNISGLGEAIATYEGQVGTLKTALTEFATTGYLSFDKATAVAATGVKGIGTDISALETKIGTLETKIKDTKIELIIEKVYFYYETR